MSGQYFKSGGNKITGFRIFLHQYFHNFPILSWILSIKVTKGIFDGVKKCFFRMFFHVVNFIS